jgi:mannose-6-phosphate isomerase-like protein (cupin superfamily)
LEKTINLSAELAKFSERWAPRRIAKINDYDVMLVKVHGTFVWHKHEATDDFFLVLKGCLEILMRDRVVTLGPGEIYVVPKGVEHCPRAADEVHLLLIEPKGTLNTGDASLSAKD